MGNRAISATDSDTRQASSRATAQRSRPAQPSSAAVGAHTLAPPSVNPLSNPPSNPPSSFSRPLVRCTIYHLHPTSSLYPLLFPPSFPSTSSSLLPPPPPPISTSASSPHFYLLRAFLALRAPLALAANRSFSLGAGTNGASVSAILRASLAPRPRTAPTGGTTFFAGSAECTAPGNAARGDGTPSGARCDPSASAPSSAVILRAGFLTWTVGPLDRWADRNDAIRANPPARGDGTPSGARCDPSPSAPSPPAPPRAESPRMLPSRRGDTATDCIRLRPRGLGRPISERVTPPAIVCTSGIPPPNWRGLPPPIPPIPPTTDPLLTRAIDRCAADSVADLFLCFTTDTLPCPPASSAPGAAPSAAGGLRRASLPNETRCDCCFLTCCGCFFGGCDPFGNEGGGGWPAGGGGPFGGGGMPPGGGGGMPPRGELLATSGFVTWDVGVSCSIITAWARRTTDDARSRFAV